ncbi:zinc finger protein 385B [Neocloeon triangulifer]|uniref:zinc finger protein 385B n=1 Tax=Neocloeon triangulifer TaxID=2078957 RepID=UPI00286FAECE|nr:zinc finger protein 385B [Neocloeon triangulifer]
MDWRSNQWDHEEINYFRNVPPPANVPQFNPNNFTIPSCQNTSSFSSFRNDEFRSPMADLDYGEGPPMERKRRVPYRGPAPHRNPAPGPMGLSGPWQDGPGGGPPPQDFRNRPRGSFRRPGFGQPTRSHFPDQHSANDQHMHPRPPPLFKDAPKNKKASPYNMSVNPSGKVDVAAAKQKLLESVLNSKDMSLPKELLEMFSPLKCDLCNAKMNSTVMAKLHYSGKTHEKKVRQYMANHKGPESEASEAKKPKLSDESGSTKPILITANLKLEESEESTSIPSNNQSNGSLEKQSAVIESQKMECVHCNVSFVSPVQAAQHFMSRNHFRRMKGLDPKNAKYYNPETCEWQVKPMQAPAEDPTGRFGIGSEFVSPPDEVVSVSVIMPKAPPDKSLKVYCDVCDCYTTSQDQMQNHLKGSRHQKKWAAKQKSQANLPQGIFLEEPAPPKETLLSAASKDNKQGVKKPGTASDMANFRTPSGNYYCSICNLSVNSESQFKTHSESKKHKSKLATIKPAPNSAVKIEVKWDPLAAPSEDASGKSFGLIPTDGEPVATKMEK